VSDPGATGILKRQAPLWWWLRENFKLPALGAIAGCILSAGAWLWSQHVDLEQLKNRDDPKPALARIEAQLSEVLQAQSAMKQQLADFGERIDRQDQKWARVEDAAEIRVPRRHQSVR
jgi:hypothetical protein